MRRAFAVLALTFTLSIAADNAQAGPGVALRWNHCSGEGTGSANRLFACDTNAGVDELVGSFALPADLSNVSGNEIVVVVSTGLPIRELPRLTGPPVPSWWWFRNAGTCRQTALGASFTPDPANVVCRDWGGGLQVGGLAGYNLDYSFAGTARIVAVVAVPGNALQDLPAGVEYYSFTLRIRHDNTVGNGACDGCSMGMYVVLVSLKVTTNWAPNDVILSSPLNGSDANVANWNQGVPVPTRKTSWGAVKSLYR